MKAQVTIEYLLITAAGLLLLFFSVGALIFINNYLNIAKQRYYNLYDINNLRAVSEEVCLLGDGNRRTIQLISRIENPNIDIPCRVSTPQTLEGKIKVINVEGTVIIEKS